MFVVVDTSLENACFLVMHKFLFSNFLIQVTLAHKGQPLEDLKEEVRRELIAAASDPFKQLKFIDAIQRLGVAYHFKKDIEEALQDTYYGNNDIYHDLYDDALRFRLLRQQGFCISYGKC